MNSTKPSKLDDKLDNSNQKILTQQLFHKGILLNRPRSNSFSGPTSATTPPIDLTTEASERDDHSNRKEGWNQVNYGKRHRTSPETTQQKNKQTKLNYWLATPTAIETSNPFKELEVTDDKTTSANPVPKPARPPPLFIDKVGNIQPLLNMLEEVAPGDYEIKVLRGEKVKIQPKSPESYSIIYKKLKEKNTEFYTYQPKQERCYRVVLKHLHPSTDKEEIKNALEELGHKVTNVWNINSSKTKQALPFWNIELSPNDNNKDIYKVTSLLHCRIIVEAPRPKRAVPQCSNCQEYGHTQKFCHRQPRCVKCAGPHHTSQCSRKERSDKVKCILCEGNHPANYKGCIVYKELQKVKYPTSHLAKKNMSERPRNQEEPTSKVTNNSRLYSEITKNNKNPTYPTDNTNAENLSIANELKGMREILVALMNQMIMMTKTFTDVISKLPSHSVH